MLTVICWVLLGFAPVYAATQTVTGTLKNDIVTPGGDCAHQWWLQPDGPDKTKRILVALEPADRVPPELNNRHVQVEGDPKTCHGVEGGDYPVIVIKNIKPIEQ